MTIFDFISVNEMYDGYKVKETRTLNLTHLETRMKVVKDAICYIVCRCHDGFVSISFPNEYGGSDGFSVTTEQFNSCFVSLHRKVYPKSKEIWNGKSWITNPNMCSF